MNISSFKQVNSKLPLQYLILLNVTWIVCATAIGFSLTTTNKSLDILRTYTAHSSW